MHSQKLGIKRCHADDTSSTPPNRLCYTITPVTILGTSAPAEGREIYSADPSESCIENKKISKQHNISLFLKKINKPPAVASAAELAMMGKILRNRPTLWNEEDESYENESNEEKKGIFNHSF
ncbi:MAG: hypothetical protein K2X94_04920 [Amoebophilaceae bacterium]|nr:hypothetical protein [Amoebophilaceae bacterium]